MKKISRLAALLVLAASFGAPLFVIAQEGPQACSTTPGSLLPACPTGYTCNGPNGVCVASGGGTPGSVDQKYLIYYKDTIVWVVNSVLVPVLIAIAFIVFLWGVFNYFIYSSDDEAKRKEGRQFVLWGIIGLVIIFSVWALVNIVNYTLFPSTISNIAPTPPKL